MRASTQKMREILRGHAEISRILRDIQHFVRRAAGTDVQSSWEISLIRNVELYAGIGRVGWGLFHRPDPLQPVREPRNWPQGYGLEPTGEPWKEMHERS